MWDDYGRATLNLSSHDDKKQGLRLKIKSCSLLRQGRSPVIAYTLCGIITTRCSLNNGGYPLSFKNLLFATFLVVKLS